MESISQEEYINTIEGCVQRIFRIEDITLGTSKQRFIVRYRGNLVTPDSEKAYDQLTAWLKPMGLTPLFRKHEKRHEIMVIKGLPEPKASNPLVNLLLFILTLLSVLLTGFLYGLDTPMPTEPLQIILEFFRRGWPFALSIIAILGAHEFGHYLAGRHHGLHVTLPYFIPFPFSAFGTMGAFINMKDVPKNRKVLLDVGIAGPLAGLVVAVPVLILGLNLSEMNILPQIAPNGMLLEGNSLIYLFSKYAVFGQFLPQPVDYGDMPALLYWLRYFFTGHPIPFGGADVLLHPVAWAGWAGLLITGLNLIPAGQLDGGHVLYVLLGKKWAKRVYPFILSFLIVMGFFWNGWWLWAVLIFTLGRMHAEPLDQITPLNKGRQILAVLVLIIFVLTFTPVPLILI